MEVGKWYKHVNGFVFITGFDKNRIKCFGIINKEWKDLRATDFYFGLNTDSGFTEATKQEVLEALKNEAVKKGFVEGAYYKNTRGDICVVDGLKEHFGCGLVSKDADGMIFDSGIWAEIIPAITKQEAEKLLNKKII